MLFFAKGPGRTVQCSLSGDTVPAVTPGTPENVKINMFDLNGRGKFEVEFYQLFGGFGTVPDDQISDSCFAVGEFGESRIRGAVIEICRFKTVGGNF